MNIGSAIGCDIVWKVYLASKFKLPLITKKIPFGGAKASMLYRGYKKKAFSESESE